MADASHILHATDGASASAVVERSAVTSPAVVGTTSPAPTAIADSTQSSSEVVGLGGRRGATLRRQVTLPREHLLSIEPASPAASIGSAVIEDEPPDLRDLAVTSPPIRNGSNAGRLGNHGTQQGNRAAAKALRELALRAKSSRSSRYWLKRHTDELIKNISTPTS